MERGRGRRRPTKSQRGKWVEEDMTTKSADTIKVRIKSNLNQRRKVFMNSQMLQHRRDKVIFFHVAFELKLIGGKCTRMVIKCDSTIKGKV
jgi:hypothetical protein